jgi:hypothetical protein
VATSGEAAYGENETAIDIKLKCAALPPPVAGGPHRFTACWAWSRASRWLPWRSHVTARVSWEWACSLLSWLLHDKTSQTQIALLLVWTIRCQSSTGQSAIARVSSPSRLPPTMHDTASSPTMKLSWNTPQC